MRHLFVCLDGTGNSPGQTDIEYIVRNKSPISSV